ncbi:hypothetical protein [Serratia sp. 2723]
MAEADEQASEENISVESIDTSSINGVFQQPVFTSSGAFDSPFKR